MNILALDTSAGTGVAIARDGVTLARRDESDTRGHAEAVGRLVSEALAEAQLVAADLDLVVVGVGPGPFTGLRVGIAAGIGLAAGIERPVVGVPSHDAVALARLEIEPTATTVITDARRREVFVTDYSGLDAHGLPVAATDARTEPRAWADDRPEPVVTEVPAAQLARIAWLRQQASVPQRGTDPIYVRQPDVSRAKPKRVL